MNKLKIILLVILSTLIVSQSSWAQALVEVEGELDVNGNRVTNAQDPVNVQDAATKAYVDNVLLSMGGVLGPIGVRGLLDFGYTPSQIIASGADTTDFIGLNHEGGIIFYMRQDGTGLVAAATDQSTGPEWGCQGTLITGADGKAIGTGSQNTIDIEAGCPTPGTAADLCANLMLNGFDDWFLPSLDELVEMYNKIGPGAAAPHTNIGGFDDSRSYWSSSERNELRAWYYYFSATNTVEAQAFKEGANFIDVRAIRAF